MLLITLIGYLAGTFTAGAYLPQTYKTLKTKKSGDFSIHYLAIISTGLILFIVYGFLIKAYPVAIESIASFLLSIPIIYYNVKEIKMKKNKKKFK